MHVRKIGSSLRQFGSFKPSSADFAGLMKFAGTFMKFSHCSFPIPKHLLEARTKACKQSRFSSQPLLACPPILQCMHGKFRKPAIVHPPSCMNCETNVHKACFCIAAFETGCAPSRSPHPPRAALGSSQNDSSGPTSTLYKGGHCKHVHIE